MSTYRHIYSQGEGNVFPEKGKDEKVNHGVCGEGWKYSGDDFWFLLFASQLFLSFFTTKIYYR